MTYKRTYDSSWSFRDANTKEFTHCYHTYPAMMIPQIPRRLIEEYKPTDSKLTLLFDPYMGSGTLLVEANIAGINAIGTDLNPLARFMSRVKTTHYDEAKIEEMLSYIQNHFLFYNEKLVDNRDFDRISNYSFWYTEDSLLRLSYIQQLIGRCCLDCQDFLKIALSEVVREVSFTRNGEFKRYKMTDKQLKSFNPDVFRLFETKARRNIEGLRQFNQRKNGSCSLICSFNSVEGIPADIITEGSIDMVITSPPYGDSRTTVAYGQFSRWSNEWFGFADAKNLDNLLMGGGKFKGEEIDTQSIADELMRIKTLDEKRYGEVCSFLDDYGKSIANVAKVVRSGGIVCYVVGNRTVKGVQIPLDYFTAEMFEREGFRHIDTIVREIPSKRMPLKNSPSNVVGEKVNTINNEYIVILEKDGRNTSI